MKGQCIQWQTAGNFTLALGQVGGSAVVSSHSRFCLLAHAGECSRGRFSCHLELWSLLGKKMVPLYSLRWCSSIASSLKCPGNLVWRFKGTRLITWRKRSLISWGHKHRISEDTDSFYFLGGFSFFLFFFFSFFSLKIYYSVWFFFNGSTLLTDWDSTVIHSFT